MRLPCGLIVGAVFAAVALGAPAGAQREPFSYDLFRLHGDVASAAERAREAEAAAQAAAAQARAEAERGAEAAARARAGAAGTMAYVYEDSGDLYEGDQSDGARSGYGVYSYASGSRHAGYFISGLVEGPAVYSRLDAGAGVAATFEGEFVNDVQNGVGVDTWADDVVHAGGYQGGLKTGYGVMVYQDGQRYEGEFANDRRNGAGVLWDPDGDVAYAGIWTDDALATPLEP